MRGLKLKAVFNSKAKWAEVYSIANYPFISQTQFSVSVWLPEGSQSLKNVDFFPEQEVTCLFLILFLHKILMKIILGYKWYEKHYKKYVRSVTDEYIHVPIDQYSLKFY